MEKIQMLVLQKSDSGLTILSKIAEYKTQW
jgi:hypothetical protein